MLIASLLFGISASLDALLVGVCYGVKSIRIRLWQNLVISLVTLLGTCLSVGLGTRLAALLPGAVGDCIGSIILILLGFYYIVKWGFVSLQNSKKRALPGSVEEWKEPEALIRTVFPQLKPGEVFTLSLTLSLNNLSAGLSASLAGLTLFRGQHPCLLHPLSFCRKPAGGQPLTPDSRPCSRSAFRRAAHGPWNHTAFSLIHGPVQTGAEI